MDLRKLGCEVITLDVTANSSENLHHPAVWAYLMTLARKGSLRILLGGPPCRTSSRLRHRAPGPRPLRGRKTLRWELSDLNPLEAERVHGDFALILKMAALYEEMEVNAPQPGANGFLMEHPEDPSEYLSEDESKNLPSVWEWPELRAFAEKFGLKMVAFDQGKCGHSRRKPTCLLTNLPGMDELQGLRCEKDHMGIEPLAADLPQRLQQTSSWSSWAPGLTAAIKESIKKIPMAGLKRLSLDEWQQHVRQNHTPYRRDCRLCIQEVGAGHQAKYALLVTVPIPIADGALHPGECQPPHDALPGPDAQLSGAVPHAGQVPDCGGDPSSKECLADSDAPGDEAPADRAREIISKPMQKWAARCGLFQTVTAGDDAPANGRIESEILQFKRRLRLTLQSAAAKVEEWPSVARHSSEERLRAQLQRVGLKQHAMLPYNTKVLVKTKLWHKRFTKGMASAYFQATLKGPSPLMNHGWVVKNDKGHARSVVTTDPNAERAMLELMGDPMRPIFIAFMENSLWVIKWSLQSSWMRRSSEMLQSFPVQLLWCGGVFRSSSPT
eukprot:s73_g22.t1